MSRAIWKGNIQFGLVNIPVELHPATGGKELRFRMVDRRNMAPIRYEKINAKTGRPVPNEDIVKGYEYEDDEYVLFSDSELKNIRAQGTQTVEITDFVDYDEINPLFFDKAYYLIPAKKAAKSYALLREALRRSGKVGIAKVVVQTKQHLAAVMPFENVLVLEQMRFADEIRTLEEYELPPVNQEQAGIQKKELDMADRLIDSMADKWEPGKYRDDYRENVTDLVQRKIESHQTKTLIEEEEPKKPKEEKADVVDMMELLKQSLAQAGGKGEAGRREKGEGAPPAKVAVSAGSAGKSASKEKKAPAKPPETRKRKAA